MIPKIIHYCWFGGNPLPELAVRCIESWKKYCPDYEIVEWNEHNFDVNCNTYCREAYEAKKWAFVSDVARLYALVTVGGIYMDTDVEVLKPLDDFLSCAAFSGFEEEDRISTGIMAAEKGHPLFTEFLNDYATARFNTEDGGMDMTTNVTRISNTCLKYGLQLNNTMQTVNGFTLYPKDYFCPKDFRTKVLTVTENSHTIHHFDGSWLTPEDKYFDVKRAAWRKFLPGKLAGYTAKVVAAVKFRGLGAAWTEVAKWIKKEK